MHSRADRIFAIVITLALLGALFGAAFMAWRFWFGMEHALDPAAILPMILGVVLSLVLGAFVLGIFLYGRQKEIRGQN